MYHSHILGADGSVLLDEQRGAGGGHPARGEVPLEGRAGQGHGCGLPTG